MSNNNCCTREFQKSYFCFEYERPDDMVQAQCGRYSLPFVIYRLVIALYFVAVLIYSGIEYEYGWKYFIYLTYWSYIMLNLNVVLLAINAVYGYVKWRKTSGDPEEEVFPKMTWYLKLSWILYTISSSAALVISILYWTLVYKPHFTLTIINVTTHAVNSAYVLFDLWVSGMPHRLLHFYLPMIYGLLYGIFVVVYWAAGGTGEKGDPYIYSALNFNTNPGRSTGLLFGSIFIPTPLAHVLLFGLYKAGAALYRCCGCTSESTTRERNGQTEMTPMNQP